MHVLEEVVTPQFIDLGLSEGFPPSVEGIRSLILAIHKVMPDLTIQIEDSISGEGRVELRVAAHGKEAGWTEIHIPNLERGKLIERCTVID